MIWLFAGSGITKLALAAGGAALLAGPLNSPQVWVSGHSRYTPPKATHLSSTANIDRLHQLPAGGVVVDLENWPLTPSPQRKEPITAYREAAKIAGQHGQWVVATPAIDLVRAIRPNYHGKLYPEFLRLRLAYRVAPFARVYEIQAQGLERKPALYRHFVLQAAEQVKQAHPDITVLAGLSTNPGGKPVSVAVLRRAIGLTRKVVAGYWINIPQAGRACPRCGKARPEIAVRLLEASSR